MNVLYNTLGLYLVKVASALTNALSYAILLPCTTLLFFTPIAGLAQEHFNTYSWFTVFGLVLAVCGFGCYQHYGRAVDVELKDMLTPELKATLLPDKGRHGQPSFQERIIGSGVAHGFGVDLGEVRRVCGDDVKLATPLLGSSRSSTLAASSTPEPGGRPQHA